MLPIQEILHKATRNWFLSREYNDHHVNLKSVWTGVYVLLLLWVLSLFLKHISDAVLQQRQGHALPEERRQFLQTPRERSRFVSWGDRFKRGAYMSRTAFLMLLGTTIFASLPVQHPCPREIPPPKVSSINRSRIPFFGPHLTGSDDPLINSQSVLISVKPPHSHVLLPRHYYTHHGHHPTHQRKHGLQQNDEEPIIPYPTEQPQPPRPHPPEKRPPNPHPPPVEPPSPPDHEIPSPPVPPKIGQTKCYSNSVTDGVLTLSWIFVGLSVLWYILELSVVDLKSNALTRSIMGTFSFPLIIATFAIVFNQWSLL